MGTLCIVISIVIGIVIGIIIGDNSGRINLAILGDIGNYTEVIYYMFSKILSIRNVPLQ